MNPTNKPLAVELGGKRYQMYFDLNTFEKFEEVTGRHFLDFLAALQEAAAELRPSKDGAVADRELMGFLRKLAIREIRAFIYAAVHEYDRNGEPVWPLTIGQLSRHITPGNMASLVALVMQGNARNSPEVEKEAGGDKVRPIDEGSPSTPEDGGAPFGPSDASILDSLTKS